MLINFIRSEEGAAVVEYVLLASTIILVYLGALRAALEAMEPMFETIFAAFPES